MLNLKILSQLANIGYAIPSDRNVLRSELNKHEFYWSKVEPDLSNWMADFRSVLHQYENIVVPLSGGLDSRIIFLICLDELGCKGFSTITYGVEGALDFGLAKTLSSKFDVAHTQIDLSDVKLDYEILKRFSDSNPLSVLPDSYINYLMFESYTNRKTLFISGFMGDAITHYNPKGKSKRKDFLKKNLRHDESLVDLNHVDRGLDFLQDDIFHDESAYSSEMINVIIRQKFGISKILFSKCFDFTEPLFRHPLMSNCWIYTPFADARYVSASFRDKENELNSTHPENYLPNSIYNLLFSTRIKSSSNVSKSTIVNIVKKGIRKSEIYIASKFPKYFSVSSLNKNYINDDVFFREQEGKDLVNSVINNNPSNKNCLALKKYMESHNSMKGNYGAAIWGLITLILNYGEIRDE